MKDVGQCYYCSGLSHMIWYIFDILASCNQVFDYWEPDTMDWYVLIRAHRTSLTDSCTERILTDIITLTLLSPGVTWCQATMQSNADTSYSDWDKYHQWVENNTFLCRGDVRKQSRQTAGTRGTVCNAISESGSQEILHWPLFQGE